MPADHGDERGRFINSSSFRDADVMYPRDAMHKGRASEPLTQKGSRR